MLYFTFDSEYRKAHRRISFKCMYIIFRIGVYLGILVLLHYLYEYLKNSLTTKKTKDLVKIHQEKYQEILDELRIGSAQYPSSSQELIPYKDICIDSSVGSSVGSSVDAFPTDQHDYLQQSLLSMIQET